MSSWWLTTAMWTRSTSGSSMPASWVVSSMDDGFMLFAVTEKRTKEEIDNLVNIAAL